MSTKLYRIFNFFEGQRKSERFFSSKLIASKWSYSFETFSRPTELEKHFETKWGKVFNSRKKQEKTRTFDWYGYKALFAPGYIPVDEKIESQRTKEMRKAYDKIYREDGFGASGTFYQRKTAFGAVCFANISTLRLNIEDWSCVDRLFTISETWKSFQWFCHKRSSSEFEALFRFFAMFDALVTETVDLPKYVLQDFCKEEYFIGVNPNKLESRTPYIN